MAQDPPQRFKWRCVRLEAVKAICIQRLQEIVPLMQEATRERWPKGCFEPYPFSGDSGQALSYGAKLSQAGTEVELRRDSQPGFDDGF